MGARSATRRRRRALSRSTRRSRGSTTFRGNAARSYYGEGPVPLDPGDRVADAVAPPSARPSFVGIDPSVVWDGWTGQPNVVVGEDGTIEVREGAYDGNYHFIDGTTGLPLRQPSRARDLAKGSADGPRRVPALLRGLARRTLPDRSDGPSRAEVLWSIDGSTSVDRPLRNDDWDGAALVRRLLFEGGENGWLYVMRLNRDYSALGDVRRTESSRPSRGSTTSCCANRRPRGLVENSVALHDGPLLRQLGGRSSRAGHLGRARGRLESWSGVPVLDRGRHRRERRDRRGGTSTSPASTNGSASEAARSASW